MIWKVWLQDLITKFNFCARKFLSCSILSPIRGRFSYQFPMSALAQNGSDNYNRLTTGVVVALLLTEKIVFSIT